MVHKPEAAPVTMTAGTPGGHLAVRDKTMHSLAVGTTRNMTSVVRGIFWPSLRSPHYTPGEKIKLWRGKRASGVSALWDEMLAVDLADHVTVEAGLITGSDGQPSGHGTDRRLGAMTQRVNHCRGRAQII
jgi:hypothetical protein